MTTTNDYRYKAKARAWDAMLKKLTAEKDAMQADLSYESKRLEVASLIESGDKRAEYQSLILAEFLATKNESNDLLAKACKKYISAFKAMSL